MSELVRVEDVTRRFGDVVAVDQVSLVVETGEIYALVGANGAGKSTLMRMIVGVTVPDSGRIWIAGQEMTKAPAEAKRRIGYLPEELILYDQLTGYEYLSLVSGLKGADPAEIPVEIEFFELADVQHKLVGGYSLGMRKKLGLAAATIGSPDVLVLDEPLNGLDVEMMRKLRLRLEAIRGTERSVILSSHVMSFVERISDRVGVMKSGGLANEGTPAELRRVTGLVASDFEDVFFELAG